MKRFLLWIISVALGVALLLAAVMGVSYAFTTQGGCPDAAAQFGGHFATGVGSVWRAVHGILRCLGLLRNSSLSP